MVLRMYITMLQTILGGALNVLFCKLYKGEKYPIDNGRLYKDGKRILGDNKTYVGMISMVIITMFIQLIIGLILRATDTELYCDLYNNYPNIIPYNLLAGALFGIAYMLCELPNSFLKRRYDIESGGTTKVSGRKKYAFFLLDQFDSIIGVILVLKILSGITWGQYLIYVLVGGFTHVAVNLILIVLHIRETL
ncbi:CDP-archaeol synthase [Pseudobutyrivibrio sp.]|uniref:CDP-archaeol synthase n=1 Tax=Pseudobutyrivibrio sp. TaxID=2014367 RepID=UPI0025EB45DA|nr:CDP-archaeol synthase [Pseudobutyrivibrio sp.]MBR5648463.1 CDP-archaeol synthase [Pseudobutyrivibrio sp.]